MRKSFLKFSLLVLGVFIGSLRAQDAEPAPDSSTNRNPAMVPPAGSPAEAEPAPTPLAEETPAPTPLKETLSLIDGIKSDVPGSIADTNVNRIMESKVKSQTLNPDKGFEDLFLTKNSSAVLDIHKLPVKNPGEDLEWLQTNIGIVAKSEKDPSGGFRVYAGTQVGSTQILVYERKAAVAGKRDRGNLLKVYRVTVTSEDLLSLLQEIKALIGNVEGLDIRVVGTQVVIDGAVLVPKDMRRVVAVVSKYQTEKKPVINLAEISPLTTKLLAEKMEEEIAGGKDRPREIKVKVVNGRFFLEGAVDKQAERETAVRICQAYISERYTLENSASVQSPRIPGLNECVLMVKIRQGQPADPDPIISVRVDFVTLDRNYLKSFNFRWAPGMNLKGEVGYSSDAGKFLTSFVGLLDNLFPKLETAASHGHARILKTATLLVRDGENAAKGGGAPPEAQISEVLKLPVMIQGTANSPGSFTTVPVETYIKILAKSVPGSDKVNMDISAKQSEIKSQNKEQGPTVLDNMIQTSIVVANGESAALGGLIAERRNVDITRDPASDGNAATSAQNKFELFDIGRGHSFSDSKVQFIVFATPEKLRTPSEGTEKLKRKFRLRK